MQIQKLSNRQVERRERIIRRIRQQIGQDAYSPEQEHKARRVITFLKRQCSPNWSNAAEYRRARQLEGMGY